MTPLNLQLYTCAGSVLFHSGPLLWVAPPFPSVLTCIVPKTVPQHFGRVLLFAIRESRDVAQCQEGPAWSMESFCSFVFNEINFKN